VKRPFISALQARAYENNVFFNSTTKSGKEVHMNKFRAIAVFCSCLLILAVFISRGYADVSATHEELSRKGRALFTGEEHFGEKGAPCAACHALRYRGIMGGNFGTDLTQMYTNLGDEALFEVLKSPPFAGMQKMYQERALNDEEIKALIAFAKDACNSGEKAAFHFFPWGGIGVLGITLGIFSLYKRRIR
jgi:mono/diheme cytochrome c family protein